MKITDIINENIENELALLKADLAKSKGQRSNPEEDKNRADLFKKAKDWLMSGKDYDEGESIYGADAMSAAKAAVHRLQAMKPLKYDHPTEPVEYGPSEEQRDRINDLINNYSNRVKKTQLSSTPSISQYEITIPSNFDIDKNDLVHLAYGKISFFGGDVKEVSSSPESTVYKVTVFTN